MEIDCNIIKRISYLNYIFILEISMYFLQNIRIGKWNVQSNQQIVTKLSGSHKYELSDDPLCWRSI